MLKVHLCLGMVALVLRFSDATHPGVVGQLYEHTTAVTASPTAAPTTTTAGATEEPVMEPKILLENGSLVLQSTDIKLRLAGQAAPFTVGEMIADISTLKSEVDVLKLAVAAQINTTDDRFLLLSQHIEHAIAGLTHAPTTSPTTSVPTQSPTTPAPTTGSPSVSPSTRAPTPTPTTRCLADCAAHKAARPAAASGRYSICPRGGSRFTTYCDMADGGWTQIGTIQTTGSGLGQSSNWNTWGGGKWTDAQPINLNTGGFGGPTPHSDYKNPGWWLLTVRRMKVVSTNGPRHSVQGDNRACPGTMQTIYRDNMISRSSWHSCGCRFSGISGRSGSWDTIGLAGCGDNSNENTLLQLGSGNAGGYFHNRGACMGQNSFGSYGSCSTSPSYGGAMIFVK